MEAQARGVSPLERVIDALRGAGCKPVQRGGEWRARCPGHDGTREDSLSVTEKDGTVLLHCFSEGCRYDDIMRALGLEAGDGFANARVPWNVKDFKPKLRHPPWERQPSAVYPYADESGVVLYEVCRFDDPKDFRQRRPGEGWGLGDVRRVLYRLPELIDSIGTVYVVEGEKDADRLRELGVVATTSAQGAKSARKTDWTPLEGRDVVVLPDNDPEGREYATAVTEAISRAKSIRVVQLPGLPTHGDVSDWLDAGHTLDELDKLGKETRLQAVSIEDFLTMEFPERDPLLEPWLKTQDIAMVHAWRGVGKTFFSLGVACAVATGQEFLGWSAPAPRGVLYIDGEMPAVTIQGRLLRMVASMPSAESWAQLRIVTPDLQPQGMRPLRSAEGQQDILDLLSPDIALLIFDNLSCLLGGAENDADTWQEMQEFILRLRREGHTSLLVHHSGKTGEQRGTSKREDVLDTVIHLCRPKGYRSEQGARFEVHWEKARGLFGDDAREFEAQLVTTPTGLQEWGTQGIDNSRAQEVAKLLAEGLTVTEIAGELGINKSNVSRAKKKAAEMGLV